MQSETIRNINSLAHILRLTTHVARKSGFDSIDVKGFHKGVRYTGCSRLCRIQGKYVSTLWTKINRTF